MTDKTADELTAFLDASIYPDGTHCIGFREKLVNFVVQRLDAPGPRLTADEWARVVFDALPNYGGDYEYTRVSEAVAKAIIDRLSAQPKETLPMLLGSNVQPALTKVGVREIQLGEFVRFAVKRGKFTTEQWNSLPDDEREERIKKAIHWYQMVEAEPGGIMAGNPDGPMGAVIRAELARQTAASEQPKETGKRLFCKSCSYDNDAEYVATNHKLPVLWPLCDSHATLSLVTGWKPVKISSEEGRQEISKYAAPSILAPEKDEGETP